MGNVQGQTKNAEKDKTLFQVINFIASNYILTQSFSDLESLKDPAYCDKLVIITSEVLNKYLTKGDITFLAQKIRKGVNVDEITSDNLMYLRKDELDNINIKNQVTKKRMCIGIAKYYIKIAHIFGAILTTINPTYSYKDKYGTQHTVSFSKKNTIPRDSSVKINKINLCSERINALVNGSDLSMKDPTQPIKIKPNFCQMNNDRDSSMSEKKQVLKTLIDEPGMNQLEKLYNDVYDYETGKFTGMSDEMREEYRKDLGVLYKAFTGKDEMPESIQKFSQVPLRDFGSLSGCQGEPKIHFMKEYDGSPKEELFVQYATHVRETMGQAEKDKNSLIGVLDKIFVFAVNPQTKKNEITINPKLTNEVLNEIVSETQKQIITLYVTCEKNFVAGLEIFEKIVQAHLEKQMKKKIDTIKSDLHNPSMAT